MLDFIKQPWPWWVSGPLIGLTVPILLILGNKAFGLSSNFRHICAACFPSNIPFFRYEWKKEAWNLFFAAGIVVGGFIAWNFLSYHNFNINEKLLNDLSQYGITNHADLVPSDVINWSSLFSLKGLLMIVVGGFLIGFGTRYADGCTSGHSITGMSNLQLASFVATCCFMAGGFLVANLIVPLILKL